MLTAPNPAELRARAITDLRMGLPVIVSNGEWNYLIAGVETLGPDRFGEMVAQGAELTLTDWRAKGLRIHVYDGQICRLSVDKSADLKWVNAVADPADDLRHPMKGPFKPQRSGDGLAQIDLHEFAISLLKAARLLPAALVMAAHDQLPEGLTHLPIMGDTGTFLKHITSARVPLALAEQTRLHIFRPDDGGDEHYAVEIGHVDRSKPVLTRLHSACFTGDLLGSLKCDCGPQLRGAIAQMGKDGAGILLYLNQEGRGIGLSNKMRAYDLQDQGFDTVEANHRLGFEDDERDFRIGAEILRNMGVSNVKLMTNNPAKIERMQSHGINVHERVALIRGENPFNQDYLATKAEKSGHLL